MLNSYMRDKMYEFPLICLSSLVTLTILAFIPVSMIPMILYPLKGEPKHKEVELYKQAAIIADANRDGVTSEEEFAQIYKELGIPYHMNERTNLTPSQLEKYIANHRTKKHRTNSY